MCTAEALHAYLSHLWGAGLPHVYVCTKTAHIQGLKKKKKKRLMPFSALFNPSVLAPWQQACLLCASRREGPKGQSQPEARRGRYY